MRRIGMLLAAAALLALSGCGYNTIQTLDEQASGFQSQIQVQLQRRADLIPNLVATVKGYAAHETEIFDALANARAQLAGAVKSGDLDSMAVANQQLTGALGRLIALSESNPQIKADQNFRMLQDQLEGTENRIAVARRDYNSAVQQYNSYIRRFPQVLTAKAIGSKSRKYFQADSSATSGPPKVQF
jgi:LemA protein